MTVTIRLSARQEALALPILLRHSPRTILPNCTFVISAEAAGALRKAGIDFTVLSRQANAPGLEEAGAGERI